MAPIFGSHGEGLLQTGERHLASGGLSEVARYWKAFFDAEPGAVVDIEETADRVTLNVHECPAIKHLRQGGREIVPMFCQHCYHLGNARVEASGLTMRLAGGNGSCTHVYSLTPLPPQDLSTIKEAR